MGAHATLRLNRLFGVYASLERTTFSIEETAEFEREDRWTDTGLGVGGKVWIPVEEDARLHPWATLGVSWHDVDAPIAGPAFAGVDTEGIRSLDVSAGFDLLVAGRTFFLRPTARYRKYSFEVDTPEFSGESSISYLALAVGVLVVLPLDL